MDDTRPITGPPAWPLVGHVIPYLRDKLGFLQRAAREYGSVVDLRLGPRTLLLSDAADVQHVLQTFPERYAKGSLRTTPAGRRLAGDGLLTSAGQKHLARKRLLQPLFTHAVMRRFGEAIVELAERRIRRWREGALLDVESEMMTLTRDVSGVALLGDDYGNDSPGFADAIQDWRRYLQYWFDVPLPFRESIPLPVVTRHRRARVLIRQTLARHLRTRERAPRNDLLSMLAALRSENFTDEDVIDEAQMIALTAYDTVAEALTWAWYLLAQHPQVEARVVNEIEAVAGGHRITVDHAQQMAYLKMVLAETLRLFPPSWLFTRVALESDRLPGGAAIRSGVTLFISPWVIQRREEYFPDPERFDPARFADDLAAGRPAFAYLPFGAGRHVCIGQAMARLECILALAVIARQWQLRLATDWPVQPSPRLTLRPRHGLPMYVRRR